ncbi:hypothetical protein HZA97_06315 [Candidatus Woesearchaeota archaeon]|nr:hypothetical protein [Candidatus Woesearchaeota archaeon]
MNQNILGEKRKSNFDDDLADVVNEIFDKMPDVVVPEKKVFVPGSFFVEDQEYAYVLKSVQLRDEVINVGWSKCLFDNGNSHNLDWWNDYTKDRGWKIPSAELYFTSLLALHENKDGKQAKLIKKVRQMFAKDFSEYFMMTSTRVTYVAKSKDRIIHDYGSNQNVVVMDFVGPDGYVNSQSKFESEMDVLLGTRNCRKVEEIFNWVAGKRTEFWRVNGKTNLREERAVVLGVGSNEFVISACDDACRPARAVFVIK